MPAPDFGDGSGTIDLGGPSTSDAEEFAADDEACRYIFTDGGIEFGNLQLGAHTGTYAPPSSRTYCRIWAQRKAREHSCG